MNTFKLSKFVNGIRNRSSPILKQRTSQLNNELEPEKAFPTPCASISVFKCSKRSDGLKKTAFDSKFEAYNFDLGDMDNLLTLSEQELIELADPIFRWTVLLWLSEKLMTKPDKNMCPLPCVVHLDCKRSFNTFPEILVRTTNNKLDALFRFKRREVDLNINAEMTNYQHISNYMRILGANLEELLFSYQAAKFQVSPRDKVKDMKEVIHFIHDIPLETIYVILPEVEIPDQGLEHGKLCRREVFFYRQPLFIEPSHFHSTAEIKKDIAMQSKLPHVCLTLNFPRVQLQSDDSFAEHGLDVATSFAPKRRETHPGAQLQRNLSKPATENGEFINYTIKQPRRMTVLEKELIFLQLSFGLLREGLPVEAFYPSNEMRTVGQPALVRLIWEMQQLCQEYTHNGIYSKDFKFTKEICASIHLYCREFKAPLSECELSVNYCGFRLLPAIMVVHARTGDNLLLYCFSRAQYEVLQSCLEFLVQFVRQSIFLRAKGDPIVQVPI